MHHFSKVHKRLWYHIALSLGSALITVALFDLLCSLSWLCKDYQIVSHYTGAEDSTTPVGMMDIIYWIFVSYRMVLSLVICIGGIFMGRRIIVIIWLLVSLVIDLIHLSETFYILSRPNLSHSWAIAIAISSCIWQELKIIRIKYRVIRRSLLVDTNNNDNCDYEYEPETFQTHWKSSNSKRKYSFQMFQENADNLLRLKYENVSDIPTKGEEGVVAKMTKSVKSINHHDHFSISQLCNNPKKTWDNCAASRFIAANAIHFIKLLRNLYNLLTWHFTGYLFGGDYQHLISTNEKAVFLEQSFICYARIFLDALTVIYIVQEKRLLLTPWIMAYIMSASATIAISLFTLLYFNLLTTLFASIYYLVFLIDLFFRCSFFIFCIKYVLETKKFI